MYSIMAVLPFSFFLLFASLSCVALANNGGAFVGLGDNNSLVIRPPRDGQVLIDGADFSALVQKVRELEVQVQALKQQAVSRSRQCKAVADTATITALGSADAKWHGGVLAGNGKIYGMPSASSTVLDN